MNKFKIKEKLMGFIDVLKKNIQLNEIPIVCVGTSTLLKV